MWRVTKPQTRPSPTKQLHSPPSIRKLSNPTCFIRMRPVGTPPLLVSRSFALSAARRAMPTHPFEEMPHVPILGEGSSVSEVMRGSFGLFGLAGPFWLTLSTTALGESVIDTIMVTNNLEQWKIPGMASSLVSQSEVGDPTAAKTSYRHYHGFVDTMGKQKPNAETVWRLGSMSTLFTAVGTWEDGPNLDLTF